MGSAPPARARKGEWSGPGESRAPCSCAGRPTPRTPAACGPRPSRCRDRHRRLRRLGDDDRHYGRLHDLLPSPGHDHGGGLEARSQGRGEEKGRERGSISQRVRRGMEPNRSGAQPQERSPTDRADVRAVRRRARVGVRSVRARRPRDRRRGGGEDHLRGRPAVRSEVRPGRGPRARRLGCGRHPGARRQAEAQAVAPSFERTREITSSVNSVVPACPPRSGVRTPAAAASSTAP